MARHSEFAIRSAMMILQFHIISWQVYGVVLQQSVSVFHEIW